jgi:hypothetical protein
LRRGAVLPTLAAPARAHSLLLRGYTVDTLPTRWIIALLLTAAAMALLIGIETRVNRAKWEAWRNYMEGSSALDILLGRHIPRLQ